MSTKGKTTKVVAKEDDAAATSPSTTTTTTEKEDAKTTAAPTTAASKKKAAATTKKDTTTTTTTTTTAASTEKKGEKRPRSDPLISRDSSYIGKILDDPNLQEGNQSKRERRPVSRSPIENPADEIKKKNIPFKSTKTILELNSDLEHKFAHLKTDEKEVLPALHKIIFSRKGKSGESLKKNILGFQGFDISGEKKERYTETLNERIDKLKRDEIKCVLSMLLLPSCSTKAASAELLFQYLTTPSKVEQIEYDGPKAQKKKATKKKDTKKKDTKKKETKKKDTKKKEEVEEEEEDEEEEEKEKEQPKKKAKKDDKKSKKEEKEEAGDTEDEKEEKKPSKKETKETGKKKEGTETDKKKK